MSNAPPWNGFDSGYVVVGVAVVALVWANTDPDAAFKIVALIVLAYCAGRTAGAHH